MTTPVGTNEAAGGGCGRFFLMGRWCARVSLYNGLYRRIRHIRHPGPKNDRNLRILGTAMIRDPDAFPVILEEIAQAIEPPREADGSWQRDGRRRAHDRQARLPRVFMARLVARSDPSLVAEVLADIAVEHGIAKAEAKDELRCVYRARLDGRRAAAIAHSCGPLAPQI